MIDFIPRTYIDNTTNDEFTFDTLIAKNKISIILGEPASGKTYQLEEYAKENNRSKLVELISLEYEEVITKDIEVILFDSIDEALSKNDSDKILIKRLTTYIKTSQSVNPNVKFIITCRYVEWKEIFSEKLKEVDKELKIYSIDDLSHEEISLILNHVGVNNDEFWKFINENYLEHLLKNILMVINLIEDFDNYKGQQLKYFEVYEKIIISHLVIKTDNERTKVLDKLSQDEVFKVLSIIAIYMTLNRQREINIENISKFTSELYDIDGIELTGEKLKLIFDTSLFNGNIKNTRFFHKSIQEYLSAYFINIKKLDIKTIKDIFAHSEGFYEEFEEVIIYLTNMEERFFYHFVDFDPLIFRRHPYLNENEQRSLLVSMLNVLQTERQKAWSKWEYIEDSSLVRLDLVVSKNEIIRSKINIKNVDSELFIYLKSVLNYNYSKELEDIVFEILENKKKNKRICIDFMRSGLIENIDYNKRLYDFIVANDLIDYEDDYLFLELFDKLYKKIDFKDLIVLIRGFSIYDKHKLFNIDINDILFWMREIINNYDKKNNPEYSDEQISILIFIVLKHYKNIEDKTILFDIIQFTDEKLIHISFSINDYEKAEFILDFHDIQDLFWEYYFNKDEDKGSPYNVLNILWYYNITVEDINYISTKYKIEEYLYHYLYIKNSMNIEIENFLMNNNKFKIFIIDLKEKQKENEKEWRQREYINTKEREEKKKKELVFYQNAIKSLNSSIDVYNIYGFADFYKEKEEKVNDKLLSDLGDKYPIFIELLKSEFKKNKLHQNIKIKINANSVYYWTYRFNYLFSVISDEEVSELIDSKKEYEKLFYHCIKRYKLSKEYFVNISQQYKNELIDISIDILYLSLTQSNYKSTKVDSELIRLYKELNIFDKTHLEKLIDTIKKIYYHKFSSLEKESKENLLQILSLDNNNYTVIKNMLRMDKDNILVYYSELVNIDVNRAIKDYRDEVYPITEEKLKFILTGKINYITPMQYNYNKFDILNISNNHRESFKDLMIILFNHGERREHQILKNLDNENKEFILVKYYTFFKEYYHPKSTYSPGIYDNMNDLINSLFSTFEEDISLLEKLQDTSNILLKTRVKRRLDLLYNDRLKNREFNNDHYKNILNSFIEEKEDKRFFDYEKLKDDLIDISLHETENRKKLFDFSEDEINDRFRTDLLIKKYNVCDQSRGGESESSKSVGERDIVIRNKESGIAETVIEAFNLESLDSTVINKHYQKLITKYDTTGNQQNFILVYSKAKDFHNLWEKYKNKYLQSEEEIEKENVKLGYTNEEKMKIVHIFTNFNNTEEISNESN